VLHFTKQTHMSLVAQALLLANACILRHAWLQQVHSL